MLCLSLATPGLTFAENEIGDSAVWLLERATAVRRGRAQNVLLKALRQLRDPELAPLFSDMVQSRNDELRIHGILGLAELSEPHALNTEFAADIDDLMLQAQLITVALDGDLLDESRMTEIVKWPEGDSTAVKMIVALKMVEEGYLTDVAPVQSLLDEVDAGDNETLQWTGALLRTQLDEAGALDELKKLALEDNPKRDVIREVLLKRVLDHKFERAGEWALRIAEEAGASRAMFFLSMRAALVSETAGAESLWLSRYASSESPAEQMHLSLLALNVSEHMSEAPYEALISSEDPLTQKIGRSGLAAARDDAAAEQAILQLIEEHHIPSNDWALCWAAEQEPARARAVMLGLLYAAASEEPRGRAARQQHAVFAAQQLIETDAKAPAVLSNLMNEFDGTMQEVILMGGIQAEEGEVTRITDGVNEWRTRAAQSMAVLLRAKHGASLSAAELEDLSLVVRGGGDLEEPLRLQAAWVYLKLTSQQQVALATVLKNSTQEARRPVPPPIRKN